jgi:hypothetical protein
VIDLIKNAEKILEGNTVLRFSYLIFLALAHFKAWRCMKESDSYD